MARCCSSLVLSFLLLVPALPAAAERVVPTGDGLPSGLMYLRGALDFGADRTVSQADAIRSFQREADRGSVAAMLRLGVAYGLGRGVPADRIAARAWFVKAAQAGAAPGMYEAARLYMKEPGGADQAQGREWLQKSAALHYTRGVALLGICKLIGRGGFVAEPVEGARLVRIAADQGNPDAAAALSAAYQGGIGVPMSRVEEAAWAERAARLGNALEQVRAGERRLAAADPADALFWASVADRIAPTEYPERVKLLRESAKRQLTPAQQAEQVRRAASWRPTQMR